MSVGLEGGLLLPGDSVMSPLLEPMTVVLGLVPIALPGMSPVLVPITGETVSVPGLVPIVGDKVTDPVDVPITGEMVTVPVDVPIMGVESLGLLGTRGVLGVVLVLGGLGLVVTGVVGASGE